MSETSVKYGGISTYDARLRGSRGRIPENDVNEKAFGYALSAQPYHGGYVKKPKFAELTGGLERRVLMAVERGPESVPLLDPRAGITLLSHGRHNRNEIAKVTEGGDDTEREDEESLVEFFAEHLE